MIWSGTFAIVLPVQGTEKESEPMRLHLLVALLVVLVGFAAVGCTDQAPRDAAAPAASLAANLDDQTTTYYLTEAKDSPSGLGLTQVPGTDKGFYRRRPLASQPFGHGKSIAAGNG